MMNATIALAGNPNVGKSTIFNGLTGIRQHTGNWPGKTIEKKEGLLRLNNGDITLVDLPGTYSLTAYSIEETIARDFIIQNKPNLVIVVVDASNLERNLYLAIQILELGAPILLALNMLDVAKERGIAIDKEILSQRLGNIPIVETVGNDGLGLDAIRDYLQSVLAETEQAAFEALAYSESIETAISQLLPAIENSPYPQRWLAVKLLEGDAQIEAELQGTELLAMAQSLRTAILEENEDDAETLITDARYMLINELVDAALRRDTNWQESWTDRIDYVVTNRLFGIPIFLLLMWLVFQFTANVSAPLVDWIGSVVDGPITGLLQLLFGWFGLQNSWLESLFLQGILPGVGGVLVFIPVLASLYVAIALLEDSGYMARAAFVMDRGMRALGLHGKSFLPMLVGFGCTVPAVYATRTLENQRERKLTAFLLTFMSCGARLPVYVLFGAAFLGEKSGNLIFAMYLLGIAVALVTGFLIRQTILRNDPVQPFVMELPPYRRPRLRDVMLQTWERTSGFIRKATSVILGMSVFIWLLLAIPVKSGSFNDVSPEDSLFGQISNFVAPVFAPAGFGEWQAAGALITGTVAKEVIIGTLSQVYLGTDASVPATTVPLGEQFSQSFYGLGNALLLTGQEALNVIPRTLNLLPFVHLPELALQSSSASNDTNALETALTSHFSLIAAFAFTTFVLLYTPCVSALAAMRQELGLRWTIQQILYTGGIAWLAAVLVFQIGTWLGGF